MGVSPVNAQDSEGITFLHSLAGKDQVYYLRKDFLLFLKTFDAFLELNPDPTLRNDKGQTPRDVLIEKFKDWKNVYKNDAASLKRTTRTYEELIQKLDAYIEAYAQQRKEAESGF